MTLRSRTVVALLTAVVTAAAVAVARTSAQENPKAADKVDLKALLKSTSAYLERFQTTLSRGIFDENYTQVVRVDNREPVQRMMSGDMFLQYLPADRNWISVHDVAEVDGEPVPDHETLEALLAKGPLERIGREVAEHNARYNIGSITRNFNEPTLPLLILGPELQKTFEFKLGVVKDAEPEVRIATLHFEEKEARDRFTFVRGAQGQHYPASGEFDIEIATGAVRRTRFTLNRDGTAVTLLTLYGWEPKAKLWVPTTFLEKYERTASSSHELISCVARYTNYREFVTSGHIKIDGSAGAGS